MKNYVQVERTITKWGRKKETTSMKFIKIYTEEQQFLGGNGEVS